MILNISKYSPNSNKKENKGYILDMKGKSNDNRNSPQNAMAYYIKEYKSSPIKIVVQDFIGYDEKDTVFALIPSHQINSYENEYHKQIGEKIFGVQCINLFKLTNNIPKQSGRNYVERRKRVKEIECNVVLQHTLSNVKKLIILDDVVTTGETFNAFEQKVKESYPQIDILCVALAKTEIE